jgi:hypothetical protein
MHQGSEEIVGGTRSKKKDKKDKKKRGRVSHISSLYFYQSRSSLLTISHLSGLEKITHRKHLLLNRRNLITVVPLMAPLILRVPEYGGVARRPVELVQVHVGLHGGGGGGLLTLLL